MPASKGRITVSCPESELSLIFADGECAGRTTVVLPNKSARIGRGDDCDIILDGETISRHHCTVTRWGSVYVIQDASRNGTFVNGQRIQQTQLHHGDQIRIGRNVLVVNLSSPMGTRSLTKRRTAPLETTSQSSSSQPITPHIVVKGLEDGVTQPFNESSITIGRRADCHVVLDADNISRAHSSVSRRDDGYYVTDLGSSNGTYLNEQRIESAQLKDGDRLRIGNYTLAVTLRGQDCILNFKRNTR
ncbi:MAG TPA: FHA domain-containing protein [Blastocatellia bacterium]|nr:FHA domain-containing protein [Blastocatellia bacterium]